MVAGDWRWRRRVVADFYPLFIYLFIILLIDKRKEMDRVDRLHTLGLKLLTYYQLSLKTSFFGQLNHLNDFAKSMTISEKKRKNVRDVCFDVLKIIINFH